MQRHIAMLFALLAACKTPSTDDGVSTLRADQTTTSVAPLSAEPWRVMYQVYERGFFDGSSPPDGKGDFAGLATKIPYLKELGVDTLLLMPVVKSTGGMGYIPRDYGIPEPDYGSQDDFKALADAAHAANIKIMLDMPLNHVSDDS